MITRLLVLAGLISLIPIAELTGQVSSYTFASSSGTYSPISGGTNYPSTVSGNLDDNNYSALPIGFTFIYNGTSYTTFGINANGWITLGSTAPSSSYAALSGGSSNNVIAAYNNDLIGRQHFVVNRTSGSPVLTVTAGNTANLTAGTPLSGTGIATGATVVSWTSTTITMSANATSAGTGSHLRAWDASTGIRYETIGSAPNRQLVVQWTGFSRYSTTASTGDFLNFQAILNETTNAVQVVYGFPAPNGTTSNTLQVGLRGATSSDFNNRTTTTDWSATTAGGSNTATCTQTNTVTPASGLTFTWSPPSCTGTPTGGTSAPATQNVCSGATPANLVVTGASSGVGITYQWQESDDNGVGDPWASVTGGSGATTTTYTPPAFSGTSIYYRLLVTCTNSGNTATSSVSSVSPPATPTTQASAITLTFPANASTATLAWTNGSGNGRFVVVNTTNSFTDPVSGTTGPATPNTVYGGSGEQVVYDGTGTSVTVTGLSCGQTYWVRVYDYFKCTTPSNSWYYNVSTATNNPNSGALASATVPYTENFGSLSALPTGWANVTSTFSVSSTHGQTGSGAYANCYSLAATRQVRTLAVGPLGANNHLTFDTRVLNYTSYPSGGAPAAGWGNVNVAISTDCGATYTTVGTYTDVAGTTWINKDVDLSAYSGQYILIRFGGSWTTGDWYVDIDNIVVQTPPTCTGTPTGGTVAPTTQTLCPGTTPANLVVSGASSDLGITYQWEESDDNGVGDPWASVTGGSGATTTTYTPPAFGGTTIYYRLLVTCTNSGNTATSTTSVINAPSAPATQASAITISFPANPSTATISWTNGSGNGRFVVVNTTNSFTDPVSGATGPAAANTVYGGSGEQVVYDGTGTSVTVTGLSCDQTYWVRVYDYFKCTTPSNSWFYNVSTATNNPNSGALASATSPYSENFGSLSALPTGWANVTGSFFVSSSHGQSGSGVYANCYSSATTNNVRTLAIGPIGATDHLTFDTRVLNYTSYPSGGAPAAGWGNVNVAISTDCGANYTTVGTYTDVAGTTWINKDIDLSAYSGQTILIRFGGSWTTGDWYVDIDNILIQAPPTCPNPSTLTSANVTATSADLNWTENGSATAWDIYLSTSSTTPLASATPTYNDVSSNPYGLTSLMGGTTYYAWVRSDCGMDNTNVSSWIGYATFSTLPANDNLADATDLNVGDACTGNSFNNAAATLESGEPIPYCISSSGHSVWYKFTGPASGVVKITTDIGTPSGISDAVMSLFKGPASGPTFSNIYEVACDDDGGSTNGAMPVISAGVEAGSTYYVRFASYGSNAGGAYCLEVLDGATASANLEDASSCSSNTRNLTTGADAFYNFQASSSGQFTFAINPQGQGLGTATGKLHISASTRFDAGGDPYLNRNFSITSTVAPTIPVKVRIYMTRLNWTDFQAACNTFYGSTPDFTDLRISHVAGADCSSAFTGTATEIAPTAFYEPPVGGIGWIEFETPSFSSYYVHSAQQLAPLPIELVSFSGKTMEQVNLLEWVTATERNVANHIVERSPDGLNNWTEIGRKTGLSASSTNTRYEIEDRAPLAKAFYRLRSVDRDGAESISNSVYLQRKGEQFGVANVAPNPTAGNVTVTFTATEEGPVTLRVVDITGRIVLEKSTQALEGVNTLTLPLDRLQAGLYNLTMTNGVEISAPVRIVKN